MIDLIKTVPLGFALMICSGSADDPFFPVPTGPTEGLSWRRQGQRKTAFGAGPAGRKK